MYMRAPLRLRFRIVASAKFFSRERHDAERSEHWIPENCVDLIGIFPEADPEIVIVKDQERDVRSP
jgi:hypothetical protein